MEKIIGIRIKQFEKGGIFTDGFAVFNVFLNENGKEVDLGDWFVNPENKYKKFAELLNLKNTYVEKGYKAVGDWD